MPAALFALFQRLQILGQEPGDILESGNIVRIDGHERLVRSRLVRVISSCDGLMDSGAQA